MRRRVLAAAILASVAAAACSQGGSPIGQPAPPPGPAPQQPAHAGIEVGYIGREPRIISPGTVLGPREAGWPVAGSAVHWVAHVINRGTTTAVAVPYQWRIDGDVVVEKLIDLPPGETEILFGWNWTFTRHDIGFAIAPPADMDPVPGDNELTVASNALSLLFNIQRGVYDWMLVDGRPGFERWAQREIERWNGILAEGVFDTSPQGATDRIRLDRINVVADTQRFADVEEMLYHDLHWMFFTDPNVVGDGRFLAKGASKAVVDDHTIVLHELLHQRGLTDLYAYDVAHYVNPANGGQMKIEENGRPVVGTPLMPSLANVIGGMLLFRSPVNGLMGSDYRYPSSLTEHCAWGLNMWAGRRTPLYLDRFRNPINQLTNEVNRIGYLWRLPQTTQVSFVDQATQARIAAADVDVFLDQHWETYRETYNARPDFTLRTDAGGAVPVTADALLAGGASSQVSKSQVVIFGVRTPQGRGFAFVPVYYFNLLYFRGFTDVGEMQVPVTIHRW